MNRLLIIAVALLALHGCTDDPVEENFAEFKYPLDVGNKWSYSYLHTSVSASEDGEAETDTIIYGICEVEALSGMNVVPNVNTTNLRSIYTKYAEEIITDSWYADSTLGLYNYAYRNASQVFVRPSQPEESDGSGYYKGNLKLDTGLRSFNLFSALPIVTNEDNDISYEDPPQLVIPYPLQVGYQWNFRPRDDPFLIDKSIEDPDYVTVPAGQFRCFVIRWMYDFDEDNVYDHDAYVIDWIANIGLVRRIAVIKMVERINEDGEILEYSDLILEYELIDYEH